LRMVEKSFLFIFLIVFPKLSSRTCPRRFDA
jgi:hypothetical protein